MRLRLALPLAVLAAGAPAAAQSISFAGPTPQLVVNSATAGLQPNAVSVSSSYDLTTANANGGRIAVRLAQPLPSGFVLRITVAAPAGATSAGPLTLTTTNQDAVTALPRNKTFTNVAITYQLSGVRVSDGVSAPTNYGVVFTVY